MQTTDMPQMTKAPQASAPPRLDEYGDLLRLLLDHAVEKDDDTRHVAHWLAESCLGENHLWQDMGLPNREQLNQLMHAHFPALAKQNTHNMKWKKFFYRALCEREEILICKSPTCGTCVDFQHCFDPENTAP